MLYIREVQIQAFHNVMVLCALRTRMVQRMCRQGTYSVPPRYLNLTETICTLAIPVSLYQRPT